MKTIVITDNLDLTLGLRLSGFESEIVESEDEALKAIDKYMNDKNIGLILISESLTKKHYDEIVELKLRSKGAIISILPELGKKFSSGIEAYVSEAIGIKV